MKISIRRSQAFIERFPAGSNIVTDTSAIIYLTKADLFQKIAQAYRVLISQTVFQELSLAETNRFPETKRIQRIFDQCGLAAYSVKDLPQTGPAPFWMQGITLQGGEKEVLALYAHYGDGFILTDDLQLIKFCAQHDLPYTSTILTPCLLYRYNLIQLTTAERSIELIYRIGFFSHKIYTIAQQLLILLTEESLNF